MLHHLYARRALVALAATTLLLSPAHSLRGQRKKNQPRRAVADDGSLGATRVKVFKTVGDVKLKMRIYEPRGHKPTDRRPAVVFFFGGGWRSGSPKQFAQHSLYFATRGMVAMTAEYRVHSRHKAQVKQCVADARSAIRWARKNASALGVDPGRIAAGGGSAGGHLGAAVATLDAFDEPGEEKSISAAPNALLLFNPALDLRPKAFGAQFRSARYGEISARFGAPAAQLSPQANVVKGLPPTIIFHGAKDRTVPLSQAEAFQKSMRSAGNRCELMIAQGEEHGFFNFGRGGNKQFVATVTRADKFLASLEYVKGPPRAAEFVESRRKR